MALNDNYTGIYLFRIFIQKIKVKNLLVFSLYATITDTRGWKLINCEIKIHIRLKFYDLRYFFIEFYIIITYQISWEKFNISQAWYNTWHQVSNESHCHFSIKLEKRNVSDTIHISFACTWELQFLYNCKVRNWHFYWG